MTFDAFPHISGGLYKPEWKPVDFSQLLGGNNMAEFDVTLSAMQEAATNIRNYTEQFRDEAEQTYQAAQTLSEGWVGDASQTFVDNMEQLHTWMNELVATLETYSAELEKSRDKYETTDISASKNFK